MRQPIHKNEARKKKNRTRPSRLENARNDRGESIRCPSVRVRVCPCPGGTQGLSNLQAKSYEARVTTKSAMCSIASR